MTIRKGETWGSPGALPPDGVIAAGDAAAAELVTPAWAAGAPLPVVGLTGGDLWRTLGAPAGGEARLRSGAATVFTVDLGAVRLDDGAERLFMAHLVARSRGWGDVFLVANAQWLGRWNVGPRAHPNDGRLDTYRAGLGLRERLQVRRRLPLGAHLPHPGIAAGRVGEEAAAGTVDLGRPLAVRLDGRDAGRHRRIALRAIPDALTVVV